MSRVGGTRQEYPHRLAGVHEHGDRVRVVVLQNRAAPAVLEARSLAAGDGPGLRTLLRRHRVEEVVRLAPAGQTICKCVSVPAGDEGAIGSALSLLAEAQLPDGLPAYRRAAGAILDLDQGATRTGLLTGWRVTGAPPDMLDDETEERWTTVPAALAVLGSARGLCWFDDPASHAVSIVARGPSRTVARVLIATSEGDAAIRETAEAAGLDTSMIERRALGLDPSARQRLTAEVKGISADPQWIDEFGLALGAALVAAAPEPSVRSLADLSARPPESRLLPSERVMGWLSVPARAHAVIAVSLVLVLLAPLGVSWARAGVLRSRAQALDSQAAARDELIRQAALYQAMEQSRWPMTKLLADIAAATPVGVVLDSVRLSPETGIGLDGTAKSSDQLNELQAAFNKTGLFRDLRVDRSESLDSGVKFSVSGKVASPHVKVAAAEDFASQTLAARLYGEGASNTTYVAQRPDASEGARRSRPDRDTDDDPAESARAPQRPSETAPSNAAVPPPITDEQIAKLPKGEAGKLWAERRKTLSANATLDQATKDRLTAEADKLLKQFQGGGGG